MKKGTIAFLITFFLFCGILFADEIHHAVEQNNLSKVKLLIESKPSLVNSKDSDGWTPLEFAARFGRKEIAEYLISKKADVNTADKSGFTPLHQAASYGQVEIIKLLVSKKANVNSRTTGGVSPLGLAKSNGQREAVKVIKDKGGK
ncbi:ankyrin repeat domain-containing protein [bacterium]|nr:ankyrin repeat domain-containing protein [bacterium]